MTKDRLAGWQKRLDAGDFHGLPLVEEVLSHVLGDWREERAEDMNEFGSFCGALAKMLKSERTMPIGEERREVE